MSYEMDRLVEVQETLKTIEPMGDFERRYRLAVIGALIRLLLRCA